MAERTGPAGAASRCSAPAGPLHPGPDGEIDRRKGVVADGLVLFGPGARDHEPPEHHHHPPAAGVQGAQDTVPQVLFGVGDLAGDGLLGAGQDDGLAGVLHQVAQGCRRIGQGVGAVAEDETVVAAVILFDGPGHVQPQGRAHVGAGRCCTGPGCPAGTAGPGPAYGPAAPRWTAPAAAPGGCARWRWCRRW